MQSSPQQQVALSWVTEGSGNLVVKAVAGAGKTTLLINMLSSTQGEVQFAAYNKSIAQEIESRVAPLNLKHRVKTGTCHSFGFASIRAAYRKVKVDAKKLDVIASERIEDWEIRRFCIASARMAKQLGYQVDPDFNWDNMITHFSLDDLLPDTISYSKAIQETEKLLFWSNSLLSKVVDFDDMVYGPLVNNLPFKRCDWVFLDEAQDANYVRRQMVKKMLKEGGRLVAVGDEHQAIFGFTGADHESLKSIEEEFSCQTLPLSVTFRCPKNIVKVAQKWVGHIEAHPTAPEGVVDSCTVESALENEVFRPEDAILCRNTKPLVEMAYKLIRHGTACHVEGRAIGEGLIRLVTRWKRVKTVSELEEKLEKWSSAEMGKASEKGNTEKCSIIEDQVGTLQVLMENCSPSDSVQKLVANIRELFSDSDGNRKKVLTLSTIHKAKGREWDRVFALNMDSLSPSRWARKAWELEQETNLCYVQVTRAKKHLTLLTSGNI